MLKRLRVWIGAHQSAVFVLSMMLIGLLYASIWKAAPISVPDSVSYLQAATDLKDGRLDELNERTPGYPFLLWIAGSSESPSRFLYYLQLSLHFLSVSLLTLLLERLSIARRYIALFLFLSMIPPSVVYAAYVLSESLTQCILVAGAVALLFWICTGNVVLLIGSGLAIALSALVRPTYQLLFVPLSVGMLLLMKYFRETRKRLLWAAVGVSAASVIIVGGFASYNFAHFGYFKLAPLDGFYLSSRTVRILERLPDEYAAVRETLIRYRDSDLVARGGQHTGVLYYWVAIPELQRQTGFSRNELSGYLRKMNILLIRKAPLEYLLEVTRAAAAYWFPATTRLSNFDSRAIQSLWSAIHFIAVILFFCIACAMLGWWMLRAAIPPHLKQRFAGQSAYAQVSLLGLLVPMCIIFYSMAPSVMIESGTARLRAPTDVLMFFVIALGLDMLSRRGGIGAGTELPS